MPNTVISYPIPPYSNVPIESQNFQPSLFFINAIALGQTTTINTTVNHNYVIGQEVRLLIPPGYGAYQLDEQTGLVINIPAANQVIINLNSIGAQPFVNANTNFQPQIVAVGDINNGIISSTGLSIPTTNIPGSFINIST